MRRDRALRAAAALTALLLGACASRGTTLVVVVPSPSGHIGGVVVDGGGSKAVLDQPYAAARVGSNGAVSGDQLSSEDVDRQFAEAKAALPPRPVSFTLYFNEGTADFTIETRAMAADVFAEIARRPAAEITVIGHTDRVGLQKDNDQLSRQRAERIRHDLIRLGLAQESIRAAGRGEREPLVATADEMTEPKNRRVEISVR